MGLSNLGIAKVVRCHLLPCPGRARSRTPPTPAKMGPLCPPASTLRWQALAQFQNTLTLCPSRVVTLATIAIYPCTIGGEAPLQFCAAPVLCETAVRNTSAELSADATPVSAART